MKKQILTALVSSLFISNAIANADPDTDVNDYELTYFNNNSNDYYDYYELTVGYHSLFPNNVTNVNNNPYDLYTSLTVGNGNNHTQKFYISGNDGTNDNRTYNLNNFLQYAGYMTAPNASFEQKAMTIYILNLAAIKLADLGYNNTQIKSCFVDYDGGVINNNSFVITATILNSWANQVKNNCVSE